MAIRRLRQRQQPELLPNEVRPRRQTVIRYVYFTTILLLALWLGDLFLGGLFYLRSEGQVLGESSIVAAEFPITVRDIRVNVGDRVTVGEAIAIVSSQAVVENLARFSGEQADRALRLGEVRIRSETVSAVVALAQTRMNLAADARHKFDSLLSSGYLPLDKRTAAVDSEFRSRQDVAQLIAEQGALAGQIAGLMRAVAEADAAVAKLQELYDGGVLRAPVDGIVGRRLAENGTVLQPGQPLLDLYKDTRFVLAFLPTGGLFSVSPGDSVVVSTGLQRFVGTISSIEPVAAVVPGEFQRAFAPVDRQQLLRITFDPEQTPPPLFTKVAVRSALSWHWGANMALSIAQWWRRFV